MEMKLELVPIPVADLERSKAFYAEKIGFNVDFDMETNATTRFIQLTPPGSGCSILISKGLPEISDVTPGSAKGLTLVVPNIETTRSTLIERGVTVGEIIVYPRDIKFAHFSDPDGNTWQLQEIPPGI